MIDIIRNQLPPYQEATWDDTEGYTNLKQAAVLLPLAYLQEKLVLIFTKRTDGLAQHANQVSFPGGMRESQDLTPITTALRETSEEIGISEKEIDILGMIAPSYSSTGFYVQPVVGFLLLDMNGMKINSTEVRRLFCVPLSWLKRQRNHYQADYQTSSGDIHRLWFFRKFEGEIIWGLTAQITLDFLQLI